MGKKKFDSTFFFMFLIIGIAWLILLINEVTRPYGWMVFGLCLLIGGIISFYIRISFDVSLKNQIEGILIHIERVEDSDGHSYKLHYRYRYNNEEKYYKSKVSFLFYPKSRHIGEKAILLIQANDPNKIRIKKRLYMLREYFVAFFVFIIGLLIIIYGLSLVN